MVMLKLQKKNIFVCLFWVFFKATVARIFITQNIIHLLFYSSIIDVLLLVRTEIQINDNIYIEENVRSTTLWPFRRLIF